MLVVKGRSLPYITNHDSVRKYNNRESDYLTGVTI